MSKRMVHGMLLARSTVLQQMRAGAMTLDLLLARPVVTTVQRSPSRHSMMEMGTAGCMEAGSISIEAR